MPLLSREKFDENRDFALAFAPKLNSAIEVTFKSIQWAAACGLVKFLGDKTGDIWLKSAFYLLLILLANYLLFQLMGLLPPLKLGITGWPLTARVAGYLIGFLATLCIVDVVVLHAVTAISQNYR